MAGDMGDGQDRKAPLRVRGLRVTDPISLANQRTQGIRSPRAQLWSHKGTHTYPATANSTMLPKTVVQNYNAEPHPSTQIYLDISFLLLFYTNVHLKFKTNKPTIKIYRNFNTYRGILQDDQILVCWLSALLWWVYLFP